MAMILMGTSKECPPKSPHFFLLNNITLISKGTHHEARPEGATWAQLPGFRYLFAANRRVKTVGVQKHEGGVVTSLIQIHFVPEGIVGGWWLVPFMGSIPAGAGFSPQSSLPILIGSGRICSSMILLLL